MRERVVIQTPDQVILIGSYFRLEETKRAVVLLHMYPAERSSWHPFQESLAQKGIASLAIDLRGHGESVTKAGKPIDYQNFTAAEHQASLIDVQTAYTWMVNRGFDPAHVGVGGASIGANLALVFAADEVRVPAVVLLSTGENYHGIETFEAAKRLNPGQALLMAASQGDDQSSFDDSKQILALARCRDKQLEEFISSGHGTQLFLSQPAFVERAITWLDAHL